MTKPTIVNKEVARLLGNVDYNGGDENVANKVRRFLNEVHNQATDATQGWMDDNGVSVEDVANAFRYGWELPYEIKAGDIVMNTLHNSLVHVVANGTTRDKWDRWLSVDFVKNSEEGRYILVCKAEDRQDI